MLKVLILVLVILFPFSVAHTSDEPACTTAEMIDSVNSIASDFAASLSAGDDLQQAFDTAQTKLADIRTKCMPVPEGIHAKSDSRDKINIGKLPDGTYEVSVLNGGTLIVTTNLFHDNRGCTWEKEVPFVIRGNNPVKLTAKDCDMQLTNPSGYTIELVFTPYAERNP